MWSLDPAVLSGSHPNYAVQIYQDDDESFNHLPNNIPPININIDTALATSSANHRGPSSSVSTTPLTPGLVSPSHPHYASSPSVQTVTPPTPLHTLRPVSDVYPSFPPSAPVSPYPSQRSPWHMSNAVRIFIIHSSHISLNSFHLIATISGARASHTIHRASRSIQRAPTGPYGATEAIQASHFQ